MPVVNYHAVNGKIRSESTGGGRTDYLTDALGSVVATVNSSAQVVNTYRYKPCGQTLAKTGVGADPRFGWTGDTGSRRTERSFSDHYNRARHVAILLSAWTTRDLLWPIVDPFSYAESNPATTADPSGLLPNLRDCAAGLPGDRFAALSDCLGKLCQAVADSKKMVEIRKCAAQNYIPVASLEDCLKKFCSGKGNISCGPCERTDPVTCKYLYWTAYPLEPDFCTYYCRPRAIKVPKCGFTKCGPEADPSQPIRICTYWWNGSLQRDCNCPLQGPPVSCNAFPTSTFIHEVLHACGECPAWDGEAHDARYDRAAQCIARKVGCYPYGLS